MKASIGISSNGIWDRQIPICRIVLSIKTPHPAGWGIIFLCVVEADHGIAVDTVAAQGFFDLQRQFLFGQTQVIGDLQIENNAVVLAVADQPEIKQK